MASMNGPHAIGLVIDGLRASALGTYGNTNYPTPHLDALASRSLVVDWLWADSPYVDDFYRSIWQGIHGRRMTSSSGQLAVTDGLLQSGVELTLLTDDLEVKQLAEEAQFHDTTCLASYAGTAANQVENTTLASFFTECIEQVASWIEKSSQTESSQLLWLHTRGMVGPWDAPLAFRSELLDEGDPPPLEIVEPPTVMHDVADPDVLLSYRVAYAAQVMVLDTCLGAFFQGLEDMLAGLPMLVLLQGSRGFALGEHGHVGSECDVLFSERLHLPWIVHRTGNAQPVPRLQGFAQPADIGATLLEWFGVAPFESTLDGRSVLPHLAGSTGTLRQIAATFGSSAGAVLRTPHWFFWDPQRTSAKENRPELFSKPDDRWESNDVSSRCPEIVEQLQQELARFQSACEKGNPLPQAERCQE